jgi:hypothetical protein
MRFVWKAAAEGVAIGVVAALVFWAVVGVVALVAGAL